MPTLYLAFCEQTHARNQGFAAGDNIDKECLTLFVTEEQLAELEPLLIRVDELAEDALNRACEKWIVAGNPAEKCEGEGEEFVGLKFLEWWTNDEPNYLASDNQFYSSNSEQCKLRLEALIKELNVS